MRDGASTFRANFQSLEDTRGKYKDMAGDENLPNTRFMNEPAIENTYSKAMELQKQIGPYIPPSERGGITGAVADLASKILGTGGSKSANANTFRKSGSVVSQDEVAQYAMKHNMRAKDAATTLQGMGYAIH